MGRKFLTTKVMALCCVVLVAMVPVSAHAFTLSGDSPPTASGQPDSSNPRHPCGETGETSPEKPHCSHCTGRECQHDSCVSPGANAAALLSTPSLLALISPGRQAGMTLPFTLPGLTAPPFRPPRS